MDTIKLSDRQRQFVESTSTAIVLSAGAGSGKTEVVVHRIARILSDSRDEAFRVLALSYTVKAADQLRSRTKLRLGSTGERVEAETIHGFAHGLIRQHGSRLGLSGNPELLRRDEDRVDLLVSWLRDTGRAIPEDPKSELGRLDLDRARCRPNSLSDVWREALASVGAVDYPAMLELATDLLDGRWLSKYLRRVYRHVVVDEAQNLTQAQARFLGKLIGPPGEDHVAFALVGDSRQSIVGFAGAESNLMEDFARAYNPTAIQLNTNYRSARHITDAAHRVASLLEGPESGEDRSIYPANGLIRADSFSDEESEGRAVAERVTDILSHGIDKSILAPGESSSVRPEEIAVLGRTAANLTAARIQFDHLGVKTTSGSSENDWLESTAGNIILEVIGFRAAPNHRYTRKRLAELAGVPSLEWKNVADIIAMSNLPEVGKLTPAAMCSEPAEMVARLLDIDLGEPGWPQDVRTIKSAWDEFADATPQRERTYSNFQLFIARVQRGNFESPGVRLLTIHRAQGREFKVVFLVGCNDGQLPDFRAKDPESVKAELRAFYVAITRAARALYISRALHRRTRYGSRKTDPSRFLSLVA